MADSRAAAGPQRFDVGDVGEALSRRGPEPLHRQISELIREQIRAGAWPNHYKLRAEPDLALELGVSRGTLRRGLRTLIEEGLLTQVHGKGTFVAGAVMEQPIAQEMVSLAEALQAQRMSFTTRVLSCQPRVGPGRIAALLDVPADTALWRLQRVRDVERVPVIVLDNWVRVDRCPDLNKKDLVNRSLFAVLEHDYRLALGTGRRTFEAQAADARIAKALRISPGQPVLYLEQVTYSKDAGPVEYSDVWIRGDSLRLSSLLTRR